MNSKLIVAIVIGVVLFLGGGAFFLSQNRAQAPTTSTPEVTSTQDPSPTMSEAVSPTGAVEGETTGEVKEFTVTGSNFTFAPKELRVKKGDTVKIVFKNSGGFHDFVIDEFNVKTAQIQGGAEETVEFVADQAGEFEYYCSVGNHRQMGMKGTLIVE